MIQFFKKIRKQLISENKVGKYLKYAIGEIMLIMIGILIALQINIWNEDRKTELVEIAMIENLKSNLIDSKEQLKRGIKYSKVSITEYNKIIHFMKMDLPYSDSLNRAFGLLTLWWSPDLTTSAYETLKIKGLEVINDENLRDIIVSIFESSFKNLESDIEDMEYALHQSVVLPFYTKHIKRLNEEGLDMAKPNDFESLKLNEEFHNILSYIIRVRKRAVGTFENRVTDIEIAIDLIDKELASRGH